MRQSKGVPPGPMIVPVQLLSSASSPSARPYETDPSPRPFSPFSSSSISRNERGTTTPDMAAATSALPGRPPGGAEGQLPPAAARLPPAGASACACRAGCGGGSGGAPLARCGPSPLPPPPAPPATPVRKKKRAGVASARACVLICVARHRPGPGEQACHRRCWCARRSVASVGARSRDWIHSSVNRCTSRGQKRTPSRSAWMKLGLRELHPLFFFLVGRWGRGRSERTGRAGVRGGDRRSAASAEGDGGRGEGVRRLRGPPSLPRGESGGGEPRASALRPLRCRARARTPCARATHRRTHPRRFFLFFFIIILW